MSAKITFDAAGHPDLPTLVLAKKNGDKIGKINAKSIETANPMNDAAEVSFIVHKYVDDVKDVFWEQIVDFKLVYCVEYDLWYEMKVELDETCETMKTVTCTQLGQAELSNINLYNIEINTENDIAREAYKTPTVLYNEENPECSLLHRIMEKAPHYQIVYVDPRIRNIQRQFSFDSTSLYDALQKICQEVNCIAKFNEVPEGFKGAVPRTISLYDLEATCKQCGHREDYYHQCPKCGSTDLYPGYGKDTSIFISSDELADSIQLSSDSDSVKNCFRLEAGDELMTAAVINCNPNGTAYMWSFSDEMKLDMSQELSDKIDEYDEIYKYYQSAHSVEINADEYNKLVAKYPKDRKEVENPIVGYSALMELYYDAIDFDLYLTSGLLPDPETYKTDATQEAAKLEEELASTPVALSSTSVITKTAADNAVLDMAKALVDPRYEVEILEEELDRLSGRTWKGKLVVTSIAYDKDEDEMTGEKEYIYKATTSEIVVSISGDYETYVKQKVDKALAKTDADNLGIVSLFEKKLQAEQVSGDDIKDSFEYALTQYGLNSLSAFDKSCETCINIFIENSSIWSDAEEVEAFKESYRKRQVAIRKEQAVREAELQIIEDIKELVEEKKLEIQDALDFESFLGTELWLEFSCFRREDKYSNSNYISDGLSTSELFANAHEFVQAATKEIKKACELQHSISTTLKNLLAIPKFKPLVDDFEPGNWMIVMIDDVPYRFRLVKYNINYDDLDNIDVEFSDVTEFNSSVRSIADVLKQAQSMASSYSSVQRQAKKGEESNAAIDSWTANGLNATNVNIVNSSDNQAQSWDENGMLFREYDPLTGTYSPEQMKIINSTMAVTDDNWETIKTAVGKFNYVDKKTNEVKTGYGLNAEAIVGQFIMGENIILENEAGTLSFNENGLYCESQRYSKDDIWTDYDLRNAVIIKPTSSPYDPIIGIKRNIWYTNDEGNEVEREDYVFAVNIQGDVKVVGNITANSLNILDAINNDTVVGLAKYAQTDASGEVTPDGKAAFSAAVGDTSFEINVSGGSGGTEAQNYSLSQLHPIAFTGSAGDIHGLHNVSKSGLATDLDQQSFITAMANNIKDDAVGLQGVAFTGHASSLDGLATVATTGSYADIPDAPNPGAKFDNPENQYTATEGQILMKTADGSKWIDLSELKQMLDALV